MLLPTQPEANLLGQLLERRLGCGGLHRRARARSEVSRLPGRARPSPHPGGLAELPISRRRSDHTLDTIPRYLPWGDPLGVGAHRTRHTALTRVEREFGILIARAYAGHSLGNPGHGSATFTYVRASLVELAEAVSVLTGEAHPLAPAQHHPLAGQPPTGQSAPKTSYGQRYEHIKVAHSPHLVCC